MDIFTHAGVGIIAAAPFLDSQPELAIGIIAGSVIPDLDALARLFGKRAFLRAHQTWSHAIPVQLLSAVIAGFVGQRLGFNGTMLACGLFAGLVVHTLLDFTNTLGVTLVAPFSPRRYCLEWVFFIDAVVVLLTGTFAGITIARFFTAGEVPLRYAVTFFTVLASYVAVKARLRYRAGSMAPEAVSILPSSLWPWRFFGVARHEDRITVFEINALTGQRHSVRELQTLDDQYAPVLANIPEVQLMRGLSPAYHVVTAIKTDAGEWVHCRDLRTRNFATTFGDIEVRLDPQRSIKEVRFHV